MVNSGAIFKLRKEEYVATGSATAGIGATFKGGAIGLASLFGIGANNPDAQNRLRNFVSVFHKGELTPLLA